MLDQQRARLRSYSRWPAYKVGTLRIQRDSLQQKCTSVQQLVQQHEAERDGALQTVETLTRKLADAQRELARLETERRTEVARQAGERTIVPERTGCLGALAALPPSASLSMETPSGTLLDTGTLPVVQPEGRLDLFELHRFIAEGRDDAAVLLLELGVDPNAFSRSSGERALHTAVRRAASSLVEQLLLHGADPRGRDAQGRSVIDLARALGHEALVAVLATHASRSAKEERRV